MTMSNGSKRAKGKDTTERRQDCRKKNKKWVMGFQLPFRTWSLSETSAKLMLEKKKSLETFPEEKRDNLVVQKCRIFQTPKLRRGRETTEPIFQSPTQGLWVTSSADDTCWATTAKKLQQTDDLKTEELTDILPLWAPQVWQLQWSL